MRTAILTLLAFTCNCFAQQPEPPVASNASQRAYQDYAARLNRAEDERNAGMFSKPLITTVQLVNSERRKVTIFGTKPEGLVIEESRRLMILPKEQLGVEDKVRFGFGTPEEMAAVAKIVREREKARIEAEKLELLRRQTEAIEASQGIAPPRETPYQKFRRDNRR